jgi:phosphotriesterase-related protein
MGTIVMTVTGPISSEELGVTLMHEHFAFGYPGWYADDSLAPYDRQAIEAVCLKVLEGLKEAGIRTVVDATPVDIGGRDPFLLRSLSEKSGLHVIALTGIYTECGGAPGYFKWLAEMGGRNTEEDLCELFTRELTIGIGKSGVKAGLLKIATSDPVITEYEKTAIRAAVRVSKGLGVSMTTHVEGPTIGPAQQDLLLELGADPKGIIIGHQNNSDDLGYHLSQLQKPGFYLGFDRTANIPMEPPGSEDNIISLIKQGYADRLILSHDSITVWLGRPWDRPATWADWTPLYLHTKLIPKMKAAGVTDEQIKTIFVDNPRRFFERG